MINIGWESDATCPGVWIGGKNIQTTVWKWTEPLQQEIAYHYWGPTFPQPEQGNCLFMYPPGGEYMFANDFCQLNSGETRKHRFICAEMGHDFVDIQ